LSDGAYALELWHGPTAAFKDMALQMLPRLLSAALRLQGEAREALILTATSGDTGKAALEGFRDVPGARILVFYPRDGVSPMQERQMVTQEGNNVGVYAVRGNFDDAQAGVKRLFADRALGERLARRGLFFSSANSINLGRLAPQVVYYFSAYCDMVSQGAVAAGEPVVFAVPTGNFGNILAALYAWEMGLPIKRLVCASNQNNVLTDFLRQGVYDRRRDFHNTLSPSMDILVSSNLERAVYLLSGNGDGLTRDAMKSLAETGRFTLPAPLRDAFARRFYADFCDDGLTRQTIADTFRHNGYLLDPHTAVAVRALDRYRQETGDGTPAVVAATASPFKFCGAALSALGADADGTEDALLKRLSALTGQPIPAPLRGLSQKPVRFTETLTPEDMPAAVLTFAQDRGQRTEGR
jgi:threonine synthase